MQVTQVTVNVHEKRNNPYEYGHYDCSVTLTAGVGPAESHEEVAAKLRLDARRHVLEECAQWISDLEAAREAQRGIEQVQHVVEMIGQISAGHYVEWFARQCQAVIDELPTTHLQALWQERLALAVEAATIAQVAPTAASEEVEQDEIPF